MLWDFLCHAWRRKDQVVTWHISCNRCSFFSECVLGNKTFLFFSILKKIKDFPFQLLKEVPSPKASSICQAFDVQQKHCERKTNFWLPQFQKSFEGYRASSSFQFEFHEFGSLIIGPSFEIEWINLLENVSLMTHNYKQWRELAKNNGKMFWFTTKHNSNNKLIGNWHLRRKVEYARAIFVFFFFCKRQRK